MIVPDKRMRYPTCSVVIPCFNAESFVGEAIESALAQTVRPREILCVDDGSVDQTLTVLRRYEEQNPDVVRVMSQTNGGAAAARNTGIREATGEWVQFLDADDLLRPRKLEHQVALIAAATRPPDLVGAAHEIHHIDGRVAFIDVEETDPHCAVILHALGRTSANLFRKASVKRAGGWNEEMPCSQEYELMYRMVRAGAAVLFDHESHTLVREREGSVGGHSEALRINMTFRRDMIHEYAQRSDADPDEIRRMYNFLLGWIRGHIAVDYEEAMGVYRDVIPNDFTPYPEGNTTRLYTFIYRLLGFERTERLRAVMGRTHRWHLR